MSEPNKPASWDPLHMLILLALGGSVALTFAGTLVDEFRSATAAVAVILLIPFDHLAKEFEVLLEVPILGPELLVPSRQWCSKLTVIPLPEVSLQDWVSLQLVAGWASLVLFCVPMLTAICWLRTNRRPDLKFRRSHSFDSLIDAQGKSWPLCRIVKSFEPLSHRVQPAAAIPDLPGGDGELKGKLLSSSQPPILPPAMEIALRPETWLKSQRIGSGGQWQENSGRVAQQSDRYLSTEAVAEAMESQMGLLWHQEYADLRPALQALATAFAVGADDRKADCKKLLVAISQLAEQSTHKSGDLDEAIQSDRKLIKKINALLFGDCGKRLLQASSHHAWQRTALASMFELARQRMGVFPSAAFLWLKREDRTLWYLLNGLGNQVAATEAAGLFAHYRAEKQAQQPLWVPMVGLGAKTLVSDYLGLEEARMTVDHLIQKEDKSLHKQPHTKARHFQFEESSIC